MRLLFGLAPDRRAAIAFVGPFVASSERRLGPVPRQTWRRPYLLGFMTMLISLSARSRGVLKSDQLGMVQIQAWTEITGFHDDRVGEDILMLSASRDVEFMAGCQNAVTFYRVYRGESLVLDASVIDEATKQPFWRDSSGSDHDQPPMWGLAAAEATGGPNGSLTLELWTHYFDRYVY